MDTATPFPASITLTTDFGLKDAYVAAMKGVMLSINPRLNLIDLSHAIGPQNVLEGALFLAAALPYYPKGSVHCVVIDPGVGTKRHPIAAAIGDQFFVGPDNGLLSFLLQDLPFQKAHIIENSDYMRAEISPTFHGRDLFAPAAAHLASGVAMEALGPPLEKLTLLNVPQARFEDDQLIHGQIIHIDHFGNCISNIPRSLLAKQHRYALQVAGITIQSIHDTYAEVAPGAALALFGSSQRLEVSIREGNAAQSLEITEGAHVTVYSK